MREASPIRDAGDLILWADDVEEVELQWAQKPLFPFGSLVIIDGDPSQGKTLLTQTIVANATNGIPLMPFGEHCGREIRCGMIGAEDELSIVVSRLRAAGWQRGNRSVAFHKLKKRRGKIEQLIFPDGIERIRAFITSGNLELVVVDPITAFLGEDVKSHVDASVRTALAPLVQVANDTGCCIILIRHLNKQNPMKAIYRGGGSIAFSAIARSGLITGQLDNGRFGIAQVKCNYAEKMPVTLSYSITGWSEDHTIAIVEWHGEADVDADTLVAGPKGKPGPNSDVQDEIIDVLEAMFAENDTWTVKDAKAEIKAAGISATEKTIKKARDRLGIRSGSEFDENGRIGGWIWTNKPHKIRGM
jgi:hypothetical protein